MNPLGVIVIPYRTRFGVRNVDSGSAGVFWVTATAEIPTREDK